VIAASATAVLTLAAWFWLLAGVEPPDVFWRLLLEDDEALAISGAAAERAVPSDPLPVLVTLSQYRFAPGGPDGPPITLQAGVAYRITFHSADVAHGVSAIPQLGIAGREVSPGDDYVVTVEPFVAGLYAFACTRVCGGGHGNMRGAIEVTAPTPARAPIGRARPTRIVPPRDPR
jgi:heme/copper-type cytochrome/quinol oxidase subunit 2